MANNHVTISTDASCIPQWGIGAWAALLRFDNYTIDFVGEARCAKINRMELLAVVEALKVLPNAMNVTVYSDSQYVVVGANFWLSDWILKGINECSRGNADLWKQLHSLMQIHEVEFKWIPAHSGDPDNEHVDRIARRITRAIDMNRLTTVVPTISPCYTICFGGFDYTLKVGKFWYKFGNVLKGSDGRAKKWKTFSGAFAARQKVNGYWLIKAPFNFGETIC